MIEELNAAVNEYRARLELEGEALSLEPPLIDGEFVEAVGDKIAIVGIERGQITGRILCSGIDHCVYIIILRELERKHSHASRACYGDDITDLRPVWFAKVVDDLRSVRSDWAEVAERNYQDILRKYPPYNSKSH